MYDSLLKSLELNLPTIWHETWRTRSLNLPGSLSGYCRSRKISMSFHFSLANWSTENRCDLCFLIYNINKDTSEESDNKGVFSLGAVDLLRLTTTYICQASSDMSQRIHSILYRNEWVNEVSHKTLISNKINQECIYM